MTFDTRDPLDIRVIRVTDPLTDPMTVLMKELLDRPHVPRHDRPHDQNCDVRAVSHCDVFHVIF